MAKLARSCKFALGGGVELGTVSGLRCSWVGRDRSGERGDSSG